MTTSFVSVVKEPKIDIWNLMKISYTQFKFKKKRGHMKIVIFIENMELFVW